MKDTSFFPDNWQPTTVNFLRTFMSEGKRPEKFLGKYRLLRKLGHGGMGVVYEAEDTLLERIVALKILPRSLAADAQAMTRFRREAQAAHRLAHPNVVALFDINQQDSHFFIAMELMPGGTTHDQLRSTGAYPWPRATQIITDACRGLTAAHENGILHRDVKPSNLLLSSDGRCKLADFGLAKAVDQTQSLTTSGTVVGTPNYMSPEQCRSEVLDHRSDIYALGATYFALLVGRPPYVGNGPMEVMFAHCSSPVPNPLDTNATIDPRCASIVQRAMAKEPAERFATTREMLTALEAVTGVQSEVAYGAADSTQAIDGLPDFAAMAQTQSSDAISARERPQRRTSSIRPGLIAAIVLGVVALGVGAIVVVVNWNPSPETTTTSTEPPTRVERPRRWSGPITAEGLSIPMDAMVSKVAFSNEGTLFAAACANAPGGVDIWTFPDGEPVVRLWRGRAITALVGQPNGFAALAGDRLLLWHRTRGESEHRLPTSGRCLALSPDNRRAAVGLAPSTRVGSRLLEISLADGSTIWEETAPPGEEWVGVDYAGSLRQLAAATDSNIHLWESANRGWEKLHILPAGNGDGDNPVTAIVVGIDRQAGDRPVLAIATEEYLRDWLRHRGGWNPDPRFDGTATREDRPIWDIALGDDGQLVAWVVRGRAIRLYHRGREGDRSLGGHRGAIRTLAFAPGSRYLASGADDETVRLWDLSEQ